MDIANQKALREWLNEAIAAKAESGEGVPTKDGPARVLRAGEDLLLVVGEDEGETAVARIRLLDGE